MWKLFAEILTSKKALATVAGLIVAGSAKYGFGLDEATVVEILGSVAAYVIGQGIADNGKEAAKIEQNGGA
jgi:hypothetical protein